MKQLRSLPIVVAAAAMAVMVPARAAGVTRQALVVGANFGGEERPLLRYAFSDAQHFAAVLQELGGLTHADTRLLSQPTRADLERSLDALERHVPAPGTPAGERSELFFYYSGHADEEGLLLGSERYSYKLLRERLQRIPADVRIAVLDACSSGAITRLKGGTSHPAFMVDASADMRGHAFLTSSSADEAAQESERLGSSYFTHFLLSGLRGAADTSGEGKVTLNEAYQFAFEETLGYTSRSRGGAQHPSYDISLSGTGDVVITDLRQTTAPLALGEELEGRCLLRDAGGRLVVELRKPRDRRIDLGLAPGRYTVLCQSGATARLGRVNLVPDRAVTLGPNDFKPTRPDPTLARGPGSSPPPPATNGRHRIALRIGGLQRQPRPAGVPELVTSETSPLSGALEYRRWFGQRFALGIESTVLDDETRLLVGDAPSVETRDLTGFLLVARYEVPLLALGPVKLRPHLTLGLGPYVRTIDVSQFDAAGNTIDLSRSATVFGGRAGLGLDFALGRHLVLGLEGGYQRAGALEGLDGRLVPLKGFDLGMSLGVGFGRQR